MCGIVGVFQPKQEGLLDRSVLQRLSNTIAYRGPDAAGTYIQPHIALGHRRLSIIDLSTGAQPLTSRDGRYTIVFNGEIYNYKQLRTELTAHYSFQTQSDTEVLLYAMVHFGPAGLSKLNGMFAFALWDNVKQELLMARDRFGKKPLYYHQTPAGEFIFASELKSILEYIPARPEVDKLALVRYLLFEYIPEPDTPFVDIKKAPAGSYMIVSAKGVSQKSWWHLFPTPTDYTGSLETPEATLDSLLDQSVSARMVADVPVGVLLSGGVDSSTIAWYMRQHTKQLHSFSVGFGEASFDESSYARLAAHSIGTTHHHVSFTLDTFQQTLATIRERLDEPLADASLLPTYAISAEAKKYVTVVLDGDGADELFYGYDTFPAYQLSLWYEQLPSFLKDAMRAIIHSLPTQHSYFSLDFKLKSFLRGMDFSADIRNQIWIGSFHDRELQQLLTPHYQEKISDVYSPVTSLMDQLKGLSPLKQLSLVYLSHYLQGDILAKIDRATMYASLEARTPFLDPALVSFALQLSEQEKYRGFRGKQILRRVMSNRIPSEILQRKKQGFGIPLGAWLRGPLRELMQTTLAPNKLDAVGIVQPAAVRKLITEHLSNKADHRKQLWTLMVLHWWHERWG